MIEDEHCRVGGEPAGGAMEVPRQRYCPVPAGSVVLSRFRFVEVSPLPAWAVPW